ncbi:adenosylcobinamide amidohydrolase [Rhizobiaceae bacterium BDR2-2]|uniref:Adenosylcobinamide amidohydrolase n=1 Tax=Ectorhizobium quercum TaxID=2965071 RepID=A0AAE3SVW2_9HYPH|nr:adenosylcobinamide amidohydrolase [Ectorhizobium quercum]MCX8998108.1 adenosylcobinamide amidohydrolase [Ectorhizobium quercum]
MNPFDISCKDGVLAVRFDAEQAMLSWSLTRPGFRRATSVAWLQVTDADLPVGLDPRTLLRDRLASAGFGDAVQMMTSRIVERHHHASARSGRAQAFCLATVGLANAGRVGEPCRAPETAGTINLLAWVNQPLDEAGLVEALSIAVEARTAAMIGLDWKPDGRTVATGTGTDCVVIACPAEGERQTYAGLHTDIGATIGKAVCRAVEAGGREWLAERATRTEGRNA